MIPVVLPCHRRSTGAAILMLSYGYQVEGDDDYLVKIAEDAMIGFAKASEPGAFLVDRFPLCMSRPSYMIARFTHFV